MFKRLRDSWKVFANRIPGTIVENTPRSPAANRKMIDAHKDLKSAIKELSKGYQLSPSTFNYAEISEKPLNSLTKEQLEELARAYYDGRPDLSVKKNVEKAFEAWTIASSIFGSIEAMYSRAMCLREGVGADKDPKIAFEDILFLAEHKNYNLAHYTVALMFLSGEGTEQNDAKAFKHFMAAGMGGVQPALHNIANCYAQGRGVAQNDHLAFLYYEAGAEAGDPFAKFTLGSWLFTGRGRDGSPPDTKKGFQWQLEAAGEGHPIAMFNIGVMYMSGEVEGVTRDHEKAVEWFEKAAAVNVVEAAVNVGNMYRLGVGVEKDLRKALSFFKSFASRNELCHSLADEVEKELQSPS